jgi:hypothetical protein
MNFALLAVLSISAVPDAEPADVFSAALGGPDVWNASCSAVLALEDGCMAAVVMAMTGMSFGDPWLVVMDPAGNVRLAVSPAEVSMPVSRDLESGGFLERGLRGGLLLAAHGEPRATGVNADAAILRLTIEGELTGVSVLGSNDDLCWSLTGLAARTDGSFLTAGNTECGLPGAFAASFSSDGRLEWILDSLKEDMFVQALAPLEGGESVLLLMGNSWSRPVFLEVDRSGRIADRRETDLPEGLSVYVIKAREARIYVGGILDGVPWIGCATTEGVLVWRTILSDYRGPVTGMDLEPGGDLAACGFRRSGEDGEYAGYCRLTGDGELLWIHEAGGGTDPVLGTVAFTPDGRMVLGGSIGVPGRDGTEYRAWILGTDRQGNGPEDFSGNGSFAAAGIRDVIVAPLGWVAACGAFPDRASAESLSARTGEMTGLETGVLWIPDWPSLSGAEAWLSYAGPFRPGDPRLAESAGKLALLCPDVYMVWAGNTVSRAATGMDEFSATIGD